MVLLYVNRAKSQFTKKVAGELKLILGPGDEDSTAVCAVPYEPVDALHPED